MTNTSFAQDKKSPVEKVAPEMMREVAPGLAQLTDEVLFGDVWKRPPLSIRDKSLITVTVLLTLSRPDQLKSHLNRALDNGLSKEELAAAITHVAFYAGWPSAAAGVTQLKAVLDERAAKGKK